MTLAKKKKKIEDNEFEYQVEKVLGVISENDKSPWGKYVITARNGENPSTTDIRNLRRAEEDGFATIGKGISLSGFEVDKLTDILVAHGFGTTEVLVNEIERRKNMYGLDEEESGDDV